MINVGKKKNLLERIKGVHLNKCEPKYETVIIDDDLGTTIDKNMKSEYVSNRCDSLKNVVTSVDNSVKRVSSSKIETMSLTRCLTLRRYQSCDNKNTDHSSSADLWQNSYSFSHISDELRDEAVWFTSSLVNPFNIDDERFSRKMPPRSLLV